MNQLIPRREVNFEFYFFFILSNVYHLIKKNIFKKINRFYSHWLT